jgi:chromosome segregation ATPase
MFAITELDCTAFLRLGTGAAERLEPVGDVAQRIADEVAGIDQRLITLRADQVALGLALDTAQAQEAEHAESRAALAKCRQQIADAESALQELDTDSAAAQATAARLAELRTEQATLTKALAPAAALADATAAARAKLGSLQAEIARLEAVVHQLEQYRGTLNRMLDMQSAQAIHNDHQAQIAAAVAPFDAEIARHANQEQ